MGQTKKPSSQELLKKNVLDAGLCTGCGACVNLCPYQVIYRDRTVQLHSCDLPDGQCYAFCPRSSIDLSALKNSLFNAADLTPEIGAVKGYYLSRATDANLRAAAQHGGTVTALMKLALAEGLIDAAIVASPAAQLTQSGFPVREKDILRNYAGSRFTVSYAVAELNKYLEQEKGKAGIVATPCQALALAKMKTAPAKGGMKKTDKLKLVVGLYCGWTLAADKLRILLHKNNINWQAVKSMDIPPGKKSLVLYTAGGEKTVPYVDIEPCIREACRYCLDSTAEFADVSVGAARFGDNWEEMRRWNQLIVRTKEGKALVDLAVERGVLEIREAPPENLKELKKAALEKKKAAMKNIAAKSGRSKNLLYLNGSDPLIKGLLQRNNRKK